jgi:hypothetical protein
VAELLQCDPGKVNDLLKAGIDMGRFERNEFSVWDDNRRMTVRVTCYRLLDPNTQSAPAKSTATAVVKGSNSLEQKIKNCLAKHPDWKDVRIAKVCRCKVADIRALR